MSIKNYSNIYFISSRRPHLNQEEELEQFIEEGDQIQPEDFVKLNQIENDAYLSDDLANVTVAYIAAMIEQKIFKSERFYCFDCEAIFNQNEKLENCLVNSTIGRTPCSSTYDICKVVAKHLILLDPDHQKNFSFNTVYCKIFREIDFDKLYKNTNFETHNSTGHEYQLVKCIVGECIKIELTKKQNYLLCSNIIKL